MEGEIRPAGVESVLRELSYPAIRSDAAAELREVTVTAGDEAVNLGGAVSDASADVFEAPEDLLAALEDALPEPA